MSDKEPTENYVAKEVTVAEKDYVVLAVGAETQRKILQKLARHGIAHLISGLAKAEAAKDLDGVKMAYTQAVVAIITNMPDEDQDYCIKESLKMTSLKGKSDPITVDDFTGRISEYVLLGAKAIGVQLGDFSYFLRQIKDLMAGPQEEKE